MLCRQLIYSKISINLLKQIVINVLYHEKNVLPKNILLSQLKRHFCGVSLLEIALSITYSF